MFLRLALGAMTFAAVLFTAARAQEDAAQDPRLGDIARFVDGYVASIQSDGYPPGLIIAVATRDGEFVKGYGVADVKTGAPATEDTLFRIASVSKTFVWVSVMMLVEEGELDLDADVNQYLKRVKLPEAFGKPVTLNDLMAHRAGFEDTLGDFFEKNSGRNFEEALLNQMPKRVAPPGERTSYSNWGTDLAAEIVADVTGLPYDEFVRTQILAPLGMSSTAMRDPAVVAGRELNDPSLEPRFASPHKFEAGAAEVMAHDSTEPIYAAGSVSLSARDAARWIRFFLDEGRAGERRLISEEGFRLMRTRNFNDRPGAPDFAHGFMESEIAGRKAFGHGGTLSGFITDLTIVPDLGVGVLVSVNGAEGATRSPDLLSRAVIEQWAGANSYASKWEGEGRKVAAEKIAGTYLGDRRLWSKFEKAAALGGDIAVAARDDGTLVVAGGGVAKRYYPLSDDLWTDRSRDAIFVYRDKTGAPRKFSWRLGTDTAERVPFLKSSAAFGAALSGVLGLSLLAFIGLWRRLGRNVPASPFGRGAAAVHLASAGLWMAFALLLTASLASVGALPLSELQAAGWPPQSLVLARMGAMAAAAGAALSAALVAPVLWGSGWSIWRKLHFTLFALSGLFALLMLYEWRLILAPMTRV